MEIKGLYRDTDAANADELKKIKKEVAAEGNVGIEIPQNTKAGNLIPVFSDVVKSGGIGPEDVVFYSLATGILKYTNQELDRWTKKISYTYSNPDNRSVQLQIELPKKNNPALIIYISTKADIEEKEKKDKRSSYEYLILSIDRHSERIANIGRDLKDGKYDYREQYQQFDGSREAYLQKINNLKINTENLLAAINKKLKQ
jgi:hypothetical protein